jgi:hypothetical protein
MELRSELGLITQLMEELATTALAGLKEEKETSQPPGYAGPVRHAAGFIFIYLFRPYGGCSVAVVII